jgi:hypothetical protein
LKKYFVSSPRTLAVDKIPCQRIPLGEVEDYKPTIVLLPRGELLLSMFTGHRLENGKIAEQAILYRRSQVRILPGVLFLADLQKNKTKAVKLSVNCAEWVR